MNIKEKLEYAKIHVRSISTHDDEKEENVRRALRDLHDYISMEMKKAHKRRKKSRPSLFKRLVAAWRG